jgi:hypothetical protein
MGESNGSTLALSGIVFDGGSAVKQILVVIPRWLGTSSGR